MRKLILWVMMFFVAVVGIPLSWMMKDGFSFNFVINAFFNSSLSTISFYILQWALILLLGYLIEISFKEKTTQSLQWANILFLIAFVANEFYMYYLILALCSFIAMGIINHELNKEKDDITTILEDVKEEYSED